MLFKPSSVYACLVGKTKEIIDELVSEGISPNISYVAWDARQDLDVELPNTDLMGVVDWTLEENEDHLVEIEFAIIISVYKDANLFREAEILDKIYSKCVHPTRPEYLVWTMKDEENNPFSQLQVTDFSIMPSGESEARTVRQVGISLIRADNVR